jgi:hypothetical protein
VPSPGRTRSDCDRRRVAARRARLEARAAPTPSALSRPPRCAGPSPNQVAAPASSLSRGRRTNHRAVRLLVSLRQLGDRPGRQFGRAPSAVPSPAFPRGRRNLLLSIPYNRFGLCDSVPGRLAPAPLRDENPFCRRLTPVRLGALEPVRQRGAGACGTVDCCHEREGQTHPREAPTDGTSCPADRGAAPPPADNRACSPGPAVRPTRFACSPPPFQAWGFTGQPLANLIARSATSSRAKRSRRRRAAACGRIRTSAPDAGARDDRRLVVKALANLELPRADGASITIRGDLGVRLYSAESTALLHRHRSPITAPTLVLCWLRGETSLSGDLTSSLRPGMPHRLAPG